MFDFTIKIDRYFLSVPDLKRLQELTGGETIHMEIVTKAKCNYTAFDKLSPWKPGRGRPPQKEKAIRLKNLFESRKEQFKESEMVLYVKKEKLCYYSTDLLWGQKLYQELRFVLVEYNEIQSLLLSLLVKAHAPAELLPEENRTVAAGAGGK